MRVAIGLISLAVSALLTSFALAESPSERMLQLLEQRIATYDKQAVEAAKVQVESLDFDSSLDEKTIEYLRSSLETLVSERSGAADADRVGEIFQSTMNKVRAEVRLLAPRHVLLATLETYSTEELVAMADFYKTDIGAGILKKTKTLQTKASSLGVYINTVVLPAALKEMISELSL